MEVQGMLQGAWAGLQEDRMRHWLTTPSTALRLSTFHSEESVLSWDDQLGSDLVSARWSFFHCVDPCRCPFRLRFVSGPQSENQTISIVGSNMGRLLVVRALTMILGCEMKGTDLNMKL
jgi:hypothetical protein